MKIILVLYIVFTISVSYGLDLREKPMILWPQYDWLGGEVEDLAQNYLIDGDYIVYQNSLGMKDGFRSERYGTIKNKVLLQEFGLPMVSYLNTEFAKKQKGIGGLLSIILDPELHWNAKNYQAKWIQEFCLENDNKVIYFLDEEVLRRYANIEYLSKYSDGVVVFTDNTLVRERTKLVSYYTRILKKAKAYNPDLKVYAGIKLPIKAISWKEVLALLEVLDEGYDGYLLQFEELENHVEVISQLLLQMRKFEQGDGSDVNL